MIFFPRIKLRTLILGVALICFGMWAIRGLVFWSTIYAPGYDEIRFQQVRVGMTSAEVESLLGPPWHKTPWWPDDDLICWSYTDARPGYSDYWRREVYFEDGIVVDIVSNYWVD